MLISSLTVMVGNAITPALPELGSVYGLEIMRPGWLQHLLWE